MGVRAFLNDFGQYVSRREPVDTLAVERHRDAQGLDDAEFVAAPTGFTECTVGGVRISNAARLQCGRCAS